MNESIYVIVLCMFALAAYRVGTATQRRRREAVHQDGSEAPLAGGRHLP